jgi:hypothetical protein
MNKNLVFILLTAFFLMLANNFIFAAPLDAECGSNARNYSSSDANYLGNFCLFGVEGFVNPPAFPAQGGSVDWSCFGIDGGVDVNCTASRDNVACTPSCTYRCGESDGCGGICPSTNVDSFYPDVDRDNHGDSIASQVNLCISCIAGSMGGYNCKTNGFVQNHDDCDDSDPNVYPGAVEICDGKNNSCSTDNFIDPGFECPNLGFNCIIPGVVDSLRSCNCSTCESNTPNSPPQIDTNGPYLASASVVDTLTGYCSDTDGTISDCNWSFTGSGCSVISQAKSGLGSLYAQSIANIRCTLVGNFDFTLTATDNALDSTSDSASVIVVSVNNSYVEVVNTPPTDVNATLEKITSGETITVKCPITASLDPDVASPASQTIRYFGRVVPEDSGVRNFIEFTQTDTSRVLLQPLDREAVICCDVKASDGIEETVVYNTCINGPNPDPESLKSDCNYPAGKFFLPLGEGVIFGNSKYDSSYTGNKIWAYSATKDPASLTTCQWGCTQNYDLNIDGYSCITLTPGNKICANPSGGFTPPSMGVSLGPQTYSGTDKNWVYRSSGTPGECEWTCLPGYTKNAITNYGCLPTASLKNCGAPYGLSGLPRGYVELGDANFVGPDKNWVFTADSTKTLLPCEWRCENNEDYLLGEDLYSCVSRISTPFVPLCSDLNFEFTSVDTNINGPKIDFNAYFSCYNRNIRINYNENIVLSQIDFFNADSVKIKSIPLAVDCSKVSLSSLAVQIDSNALGSYSYRVYYGGTFSGHDVSCEKAGVFSLVDSGVKESNIPDASPTSVVLVLAIVMVAILLAKSQKK